MNPMKKPAPIQAGHELVITKVIAAPRALVFSAWTDPVHIAAWWGPDGFTSKVVHWSAVAGTPIRVEMHGPDGTVYPMNGAFVEVAAPERFVFDSSALDAKGESMFDIRTTITFSEEGAGTRLRLVARVVRMKPEGAPYLAGMEVGWTQSLGRLANCVLGLRG